ncbi:hypothetical protein AB0I68_22975 [Streptomyces sp. NPDC050448]|uniref:hypothetical protein n=1 Tax=Streptomyces sp. NPDC050448 TaxID=3155404 RepID=UPI00343F0764
MSNISMRRAATGVIGLAVAGTLTLTGCKNGNEEAAAPSTQPSSPAAQPSSGADGYGSAAPSAAASAGSTGGGAAAPAGGIAKPGQTFKIGEAAQVPFKSGSTAGDITLTVTAVEQGQASDLDALKLGDKVKGMVPYFVRYTVKNVGSTDLSFSSVGHFKGTLSDGSEAQDVSIIGNFDKCPHESLPKGFTNGKTQTGCAIALAPSAQTKVAGAMYWGDPYNSLNNSKPLYWK